LKSAWAFYNSDGELVGGFDGAWKFYNSDGEVQATIASSPAAHAASHEDGGSDEVTIENLPTDELDTDKVLQPDGAGGVAWQDAGGGGSAWSVLTNGDPDTPELIFADGDVIETEICGGAAC
jgi:hypothetical protein